MEQYKQEVKVLLYYLAVLTVGDDGMWEGKVGEREGWFPSENVAEAKRDNSGK